MRGGGGQVLKMQESPYGKRFRKQIPPPQLGALYEHDDADPTCNAFFISHLKESPFDPPIKRRALSEHDHVYTQHCNTIV